MDSVIVANTLLEVKLHILVKKRLLNKTIHYKQTL